ncbi:MAG: NAD(P)-dependent oxidoreductase [Kiritimatiellae bacterium]|nr:NAD(P)-dependent oxidoreductase [Kiritimatiellia bacterium]
MRVLITGASGRLGRYVVRELAGRHELVLTSRRRPAEDLEAYRWVAGDLHVYEDCRRMVEGVDAIQHLGAQPWPTDHPQMRAKAESGGVAFDTTFRSNLLGTYYLLQAAVEAGVRTVVMCGSNCALGHGFRVSGTPFPIASLPIDETHSCHPEDSYSYTKRAGEDLLAMYTRAYGLRTYMTRPAGITPEDRRRKMAADAAPAKGWNDWLWCWVGSEDVASAHRLLMERADDLPRHAVYFLNADDTTALEPTRELIERFKPELSPLAAGLSGHESLLSNAKLKRAVGWQHKTSWRALR